MAQQAHRALRSATPVINLAAVIKVDEVRRVAAMSLFSEHGLALIPPFVRLAPGLPNVVAVPFKLMKLLPAEHILKCAEMSGQLDAETVVIETTSGNFGMGLALACHRRGLRLFLVGDPAITPRWRGLLEELGATVRIITTPDDAGSYQRRRLAEVERLRAAYPNHFVPRQYDNRDNADAYRPLAERLLEAVPGLDVLVGCVGSGGAMCGTARHLRRFRPDLRVVAVDTFNSVLFGQADGPRQLRGLGNSVVPANLEHALFDEVHWVSAGVAYAGTRALLRRHRLLQGGTSGAAFAVARWCAQVSADRQVAVILPDGGSRYADTIFDDEWLRTAGLIDADLPSEPVTVDSPADAVGHWCRMPWQRVTLEAVIAGARPPAAAVG